MTRVIRKSAAQTLFDRAMETWINPEVSRRIQLGLIKPPLDLESALVVWEVPSDPYVYLNDEVDSHVARVKWVTSSKSSSSRGPNTSRTASLKSVALRRPAGEHPFLCIVKGNDRRYYLWSRRTTEVLSTTDFEAARHSLATEGVRILQEPYQVSVFLDTLANRYFNTGSPNGKRALVLRRGRELIDEVTSEATARVKREISLPHLLIHNDDEFLPLLLEARSTYRDGYYFSCIAASVTTADRICLRLAEHFGVPTSEMSWLEEQTLGRKIDRLASLLLIDTYQVGILKTINTIRTRHLHPRHDISHTMLRRDARASMTLLHQLLDGTVSVYRDHAFRDGIMVPKPLQ